MGSMWKSAIVFTFVEVGGAFQAVVLPGLGVDADGEVEGGVAASEGSFARSSR